MIPAFRIRESCLSQSGWSGLCISVSIGTVSSQNMCERKADGRISPREQPTKIPLNDKTG